MRAVVTGATSMIASALIRLLVSQGHEVCAICRENSKKLDNLPKSKMIKTVFADVSQLNELEGKIDGKYDVFFHFAWSGTGGAARNDRELQQKNVEYTFDAVRLAAELGCKTFIGAGSQAEYGRVEGKLSANTPANPETEYGKAKLNAGIQSGELAQQLGIKHIWTRILSVYGPGDNDFTITVTSLKKLIAGETAQFTPAEQMWDFLYCDDAAMAFYLIAEFGKDGAVYPLGSGKAKKLSEYIKTMCDITGGKAQIGALPYNENQVMYLCADISALEADTGFVPQISYEEGIKRTVEWLKSN